MGNATTVTDTKALWGEDPDKRNSCSTSICLSSLISECSPTCIRSSYIFFCLDNKDNTGGGGALPDNPIRDVPFFRVSFFSINS